MWEMEKKRLKTKEKHNYFHVSHGDKQESLLCLCVEILLDERGSVHSKRRRSVAASLGLAVHAETLGLNTHVRVLIPTRAENMYLFFNYVLEI